MDRTETLGPAVAIVAVLYEEPEWQQTRQCIEATCLPVVYVDRGGTGSLAQAYNAGFDTAMAHINPKYVWFVSNVTFDKDMALNLCLAMDHTRAAAMHPAFASDHKHLQPNGEEPYTVVPYVEFTAPMVRADVFAAHRLDEDMPYWGHDLDWSRRVKQAGYELGVMQGMGTLVHTYIRNAQPHPVTARRAELRLKSNAATTAALMAKYGKYWREVLNYL